MKGKLYDKGLYRLFENIYGHRVLEFENKNKYTVIGEDKKSYFVYTEANFKDHELVREGKYFVVDLEEVPIYAEIPRLYLETEDGYEEIVLIDDFPTANELQAEVIVKDYYVSKKEIEEATFIESSERRTVQNPIRF